MLLKNDSTIIRVLKSQNGKSLVIDCIKRTMPKWVEFSSLSNFVECTEDVLYLAIKYICNRVKLFRVMMGME